MTKWSLVYGKISQFKIKNDSVNVNLTSVLQGILVPKLTLGPFITLSVRNEPSGSFGTNVPCILKRIKIQPYRA